MVHITVAALMDWLSLRHRHATPLHLFPQIEAGVRNNADLLLEEYQREVLAERIERIAAVLFVALIVFLVAMFIRNRRQRMDRLWFLPLPKH